MISNRLTSDRSLPPPPPFDFYVPESRVVIRVDAYGAKLSGSDVVFCLLQAANQANIYVDTRAQEMTMDSITYHSRTIRLKVIPAKNKGLTWGAFSTAIRGLTAFLVKYDFLDMDFYILMGGETVGGGLISDR